MKKGSKLYTFTFTIFVNYQHIEMSDKFFALENEICDKLKEKILKHINKQLAYHIYQIRVYENNVKIRYFTNWEDLIQQSTIA